MGYSGVTMVLLGYGYGGHEGNSPQDGPILHRRLPSNPGWIPPHCLRRPFPAGLIAWLSIAIFAIIDAACFQGFLAQGRERTSAGLGNIKPFSPFQTIVIIWLLAAYLLLRFPYPIMTMLSVGVSWSSQQMIHWHSFIHRSIFGSAISYGVYYYSATKVSLTKLSSLTFLTPMFASIFGFLCLGETFSPLQLSGAMITIVAIYLVNYRTIVE